MQLPPNITEEQFFDALQRVTKALAPNHTFGSYDADDIAQEVFIFSLECLPKYDGRGPLANFMYRHCRNRTLNLRRSQFRRPLSDCSCKTCPLSEDGHTQHEDGRHCAAFLRWQKTQNAKTNLAIVAGVAEGDVGPASPATAELDAETQDLFRVIDQCLDPELRTVYLAVREGVKAPTKRRDELRAAIKEILAEYGHGGDEEE
jgi:DNA-directed RNA polymerase specialized sigma24 family protein